MGEPNGRVATGSSSYGVKIMLPALMFVLVLMVTASF